MGASPSAKRPRRSRLSHPLDVNDVRMKFVVLRLFLLPAIGAYFVMHRLLLVVDNGGVPRHRYDTWPQQRQIQLPYHL